MPSAAIRSGRPEGNRSLLLPLARQVGVDDPHDLPLIGTRAKEHASRLQIGDAEVRRIAPVSAIVQIGLDVHAGWRCRSRSPGHTRLPGCPEQILL
jgi:hypothetical protein